ncbi:MAG: Gfo/Idh/MocA family oxidoreductase [Clostridia bacterium]|nr:Gfo/Idh/MocA family oxidoreductase [Clostridia bacterium]
MIDNKNKLVSFGIIGTGRIANRFAKEIKSISDIKIAVVYNPNFESAQKFAITNTIEKFTDEKKEFFDSCNAVYIASPHNTHYSYIKESIENGKHVLCEKPMVLKKSEAEELFALAEAKNVILMEAIKTAYLPGFIKLHDIVKNESVGKVYDVEATFTKLSDNKTTREFKIEEKGGSFTELGTYPLLAIAKLCGINYKSIKFISFIDSSGVDLYTKAYITFDESIATLKVGLGVKSEGNLVVSGDKGYVLASSPWWLTQKFKVCFEDVSKNREITSEFLGQGLSYEVNAFLEKIMSEDFSNDLYMRAISVFFAEVMETYITARANGQIEKIKI